MKLDGETADRDVAPFHGTLQRALSDGTLRVQAAGWFLPSLLA